MAQDRAKGLSALRRQRCKLIFCVRCTLCGSVHKSVPGTTSILFTPGRDGFRTWRTPPPGRAERAPAARLTAARRRRPRVTAAK